MTKLLEEGIKAIQALPEKRQDVAGELLLTIADKGSEPGFRLTAEQRAEVRQQMDEADERKFADSNDVDALRKKCGV